MMGLVEHDLVFSANQRIVLPATVAAGGRRMVLGPLQGPRGAVESSAGQSTAL